MKKVKPEKKGNYIRNYTALILLKLRRLKTDINNSLARPSF